MMDNVGNPQLQARAFEVISYMGSFAYDPLHSRLTNGELRTTERILAAEYLANLRHHADPAIPALLACLNEDSRVTHAAAVTLGRLRLQQEKVIPQVLDL